MPAFGQPMSALERLMSSLGRLMSDLRRLMSVLGRLMSALGWLMPTLGRLMSAVGQLMLCGWLNMSFSAYKVLRELRAEARRKAVHNILCGLSVIKGRKKPYC